MGWLEKVIGSVVGFAVGGPAGAVLGAGLGHAADSVDDELGAVQVPEAEAQYFDDDEGRLVLIRFSDYIPGGVFGFFQIVNEENEFVGALQPFCNENGYFMATAPIVDSHCRIYLPFGALNYPRQSEFTLVGTLFACPDENSQPVLVGRIFFLMQLPSPKKWSKVAFIKPLIDLCMSVVRADGKILPEEVSKVKQFFTNSFELEQSDMLELREALKTQRLNEIEKLVHTTMSRLPMINVVSLLELLAEVAHSDNEIHPKEVEIIKQVAAILGATESDWLEVAKALRLDVTVDDYYEILGVQKGASLSEIKAAYRKAVNDYHPDRVATLPMEFQEVAHKKMLIINKAYETLINQIT